ncbi:MAG: hypothetical protein ACE5RF_08515 [Nitrosarchaeum sp.]
MVDRRLTNFGVGLFALGFFPLFLPSVSKIIMTYVSIQLLSLQFIFGASIVCGLVCVVLGIMVRKNP